DLALLGYPVLGRLEATRAGHALHAAVAQKLLATPGACELVAPERAPVVDGRARDLPSPVESPAY
ncbi:MAG TPA: UDP-3-O-[3-hydroxymyristoyl] N-acetylglucosamine deacetylase, partial [Vicinamibacteria bacterium]|nr:UDP-3-O-[3-hydroxymyristoyl] N-acetylglucosamine deacetylase [Vicinamibacteria bacterium]